MTANRLKLFLISFLMILAPTVSQASQYLKFFPTELQEKLSPFIFEKNYKGIHSTNNHYTYFVNEENKINTPLIIVTGLEDPIPLWFMTVRRALDYGFKYIAVVEIRGQGQSDRVLPESSILYVDNFEDYSKDFLLFLDDLQSLNSQWKKSPFVIAHSTGAAVIAHTLPQWKKRFPKSVPIKMSFWTPFFKLKISPFINNSPVRWLLSLSDKVTGYLGKPLLVREYKKKSFSENTLTTDPTHFELSQKLKIDEGLGSRGLSLHWVLETLNGIDSFMANKEVWLNQPTLIFKADNEQIVDNDYSFKNSQVTTLEVSGAKHGLNIEKPETLDWVSQKTFDFFVQ